jgi:hypothetical protein
MKLNKLIIEKRSTIIDRWFKAIIATYPPDTTQFIARQKDPFANPVGSSVRDGVEGIVDGLGRGENVDQISGFLDRIIRIRAVQSFSSIEAVRFVFDLKRLVTEQVDKRDDRAEYQEELASFYGFVDELALKAFEIYVSCRVKLYEIRLNDVQRRVYTLLKRANMLCENADDLELPDLREGGIETNNNAR